jgi:acyl-homoserine lactone acylase PvdQ
VDRKASVGSQCLSYIDWLGQHPDQLPFEFKKLNYERARWAVEDVVRIRSHGLSGNLISEVARAATQTGALAFLPSDPNNTIARRYQ